MKKTIPVIGMACSVCSANVEKKLQSLEASTPPRFPWLAELPW